MSNIGFDFGTTNSIISCMDPDSGQLDCFRLNASDESYVPSVVHYGRRGVSIGSEARESEGEGSTYSCFKLLLGNSFEQTFPDGAHTCHEVARDYIRTLLESYVQEHGAVERIVMTIPESWYRDRQNVLAREHIATILSEIGCQPDQVRFQSEPVAAAAYFCWRWERENHAAYQGDLLMIDFGGGTLDVTLCRADGQNHIRVVDSSPACTGEENARGEGVGGSAFDRETVKTVFAQHGRTPELGALSSAVQEFERRLIANTRSVRQALEEYYMDPECSDDSTFQLTQSGQMPVMCSDLVRTFDRVNRPVLERALESITRLGEMDMAQVKVVMVGGFSNFCCVEKCIRDYFGNPQLDSADSRFPTLLSRENRALAIAKGAALIAEGMIQVDPVFPYEIGVVIERPCRVSTAEGCDIVSRAEDIPLIRRGDDTQRYRTPVFSPAKLSVVRGVVEQAQMYLGEGADRVPFTQELPQTLAEQQEFCFGLSVDENMLPTLHVRGSRQELSTSMNRIIAQLDETAARQ